MLERSDVVCKGQNAGLPSGIFHLQCTGRSRCQSAGLRIEFQRVRPDRNPARQRLPCTVFPLKPYREPVALRLLLLGQHPRKNHLTACRDELTDLRLSGLLYAHATANHRRFHALGKRKARSVLPIDQKQRRHSIIHAGRIPIDRRQLPRSGEKVVGCAIRIIAAQAVSRITEKGVQRVRISAGNRGYVNIYLCVEARQHDGFRFRFGRGFGRFGFRFGLDQKAAVHIGFCRLNRAVFLIFVRYFRRFLDGFRIGRLIFRNGRRLLRAVLRQIRQFVRQCRAGTRCRAQQRQNQLRICSHNPLSISRRANA